MFNSYGLDICFSGETLITSVVSPTSYPLVTGIPLDYLKYNTQYFKKLLKALLFYIDQMKSLTPFCKLIFLHFDLN